MALLAAPVSAPAEEVWLRACASAGLDLWLLSGAGGDAALGRGLEDLLLILDARECSWIALLAGPSESVEYGLSLLGAAGGSARVAALRSAGEATAAVVDGMAGASHRVLLVQCAAGELSGVRTRLAAGDVGGAVARARAVLMRDAATGWTVVGLPRGASAALWRVAVPGPSARLPAAAPLLSRRLPLGPLRAVRSRVRLPQRVTATLLALLTLLIAGGGAGWMLSHRAASGGAALGPISWGGRGATGTPGAREGAMAATWDRTAQVVLFGGATPGSGHGTPLGDTWRATVQPSATWQAVDTAPSPVARRDGAVAADPADGYVLLFGGEGAARTGLSDTWALGDAWRELAPEHAPPAGPALAATEPSTGRVLLATACCTLGAVPTEERMQTWRWTGSDWTLLGPAPGWVTNSALVADGWDGTVVMLASTGDGPGATFVWDGVTWSARGGGVGPPVVPGTRPSLTYDPRSHAVLDVVTASDGGRQTWAWDGRVWRLVEHEGGPPVIGLVLGTPVEGHAVLFGGTAVADELTQRWFWTGTGWAESIRPPAVAAAPSGQSGVAAAGDPGSGGVLLFGGESTPDETWVWSGSDWTQAFSTAAGPRPRVGATMFFDPASRQTWLVGGVGADGLQVGDMWAWGGASWRHVSVPGGLPPATAGAAGAWDRGRGVGVLAAPDPSSSSDLPVVATWLWNGVSWSRVLTDEAPPWDSGSSMAYDAVSGGVLLVVPCCHGAATQRSETWLWNGVDWRRLQTAHNPPLHAVVASDAASHRVVLVAACCAGFDGETVGAPQTWTWDGFDWTRAAGAALPALQDVGVLATGAVGDVVLAGRLAGAGPSHPLDALWGWTGDGWIRLF